MQQCTESEEPTCPVCEGWNLVRSRYVARLKVPEGEVEVPNLECYICPSCGADAVYPEQAHRNHTKYEKARERSSLEKK